MKRIIEEIVGMVLMCIFEIVYKIETVIFCAVMFVLGLLWAVFNVFGQVYAAREATQWFYGTGKYANRN